MSKIELKVCILRVILGKNNGRNGKISDGKNDVYKVFDENVLLNKKGQSLQRIHFLD